jgi:septal ring factor EnvC (AmiA/AmiB activator)
MKINKTNILLVLIACLAAYTIFQNQGIKTDVAEYNSKIESIQKDIDSVYIANDKIDDQIEKVDNHIVSVDKEINNVTKNITIIKNNTDEKVNSITTIGNIELEQLFANRYN